MLNIMRKHARNWLMKVLLGIIIIVFIFYFGSLRGRNQAESVAVINDTPISYAEVTREYQNLLEFYRQNYGKNLSDAFLKSLKLKEQALNRLINQKVILTEAETLNLSATDEELKARIFSYPAFQKEGVFSPELYRRVLRYNRTTPEEFESAQRKGLLVAKLENLIKGGAKVSEEEAYESYRLKYEKYNLDFITVDQIDFTGQVPAPDEKTLEQYLAEHGEEFRLPSQIQVRYAAFSAKDFADSVEVSDQEIENYYSEHKNEFKDAGNNVLPLSNVKEKIITELKRIKGMDPALEKVRQAYDVIYQDEDLEGYAKEHNVALKSTPFFALDNPPPELSGISELATALNSLQEKEVSSILNSSMGYYIIQVTSKKPSHIPVLSEIISKVEESYRRSERKRLAAEKAQALLEKLKKGEDLQELVGNENLALSETGLFLPSPSVPKVGFSPDLNEALFALSSENPYPDAVFSVEDKFVIVRFKDKTLINEDNWAKAKASTMQQLLRQKEEMLFQAWLEGIKADMIKTGEIKIFVQEF